MSGDGAATGARCAEAVIAHANPTTGAEIRFTTQRKRPSAEKAKGRFPSRVYHGQYAVLWRYLPPTPLVMLAGAASGIAFHYM